MLALIAVLELGVIRHQDWILHTTHWSWMRVGKAVDLREVRESRILCFGDSMIKNGILPRTIEAKSGKPAYNLSLLGGHSPASYFLLDRALRAGAKPETVIVDFERARLARAPNDPEDNYPWASLLTVAESLDLAWISHDAALGGRLVLSKLLPSVHLRPDLRATVRLKLQGQSNMSHWGQTVFRRNLRLNRGALIHQPKPNLTELSVRPDAARVFAHWEPKPGNLRYVDRFLERCQKEGIHVLWLMPPISSGLQANFDQGHAEEEWVTYARRQQKRFPNLTVVDGRRAGYPITVFSDATHLDRRGAAVLSTAVAGLLGPDGTPTPGWHSLAPFPGVWDDPRTEDLDQSGAVLAVSGGGLRR